MKKRKVLYLFPLAALVLSGCTLQEGWDATKGFFTDSVYAPVADFFAGLFGKETPKDKEEKKEEEQKQDDQGGGSDQGGDQGGGGQGGGGGQTETDPRELYGTVHEGTAADPLTGEDASLVASQLEESGSEESHPTEASYYIKGAVQKFEEDFNPTYGNYSFSIENEFVGWRLKYSSAFTKFNAGDIEVGDTVTMYAQIQNFHGTYETKGGYVDKVEKPAIDAELVSIRLEGTPKANYVAGEAYTNAGLSAIAEYDNKQEQDVTKQADWSYSKEIAEVGDESFTITATFGDKSVSQVINVTVSSGDPVHAGTEQDPFTGADAMLVGSKLGADKSTDQAYYIQGVVQSLEDTFNPTYGNFTFKIEDGFLCYRLKNGANKDAFTSADQLEVGDTVLVYSPIQNYKGDTVETTSAGYIVSITKPSVAVESVTVTPAELNLEVGQEALVSATVSPAKASQEVVWKVENPETYEVAHYVDGRVLGVNPGTARVVATSVADNTVEGYCDVTVTEATKEIVSVALSGTPKTEYVEGEEYSREGLVLTATYSDQSEEDVTELASWTISKEKADVGDTEITITAIYKELTDHMDIAVTVAEKKGTEEHPYSVSEAYALFEELSDGQNTAEFYVEGYIDSNPAPTISGGRGRFYLTDGVCATHLYVYNANNTENTNALTIDEIPVGAKALVRGAIKNYQGGFQICYVSGTAQCQLAKAVEAPVITAVGAVTGPDEVAVDGTIDPNSVTVEVTYSGVVEATVKAKTVTGDFSKAGEATAYVTIDGWEATLEFTVTVVSGTVLTEQEVYKLDGMTTGGSNGYADAGELEQGGVTWTVMGNSTMAPWRIGGKSITNTDRPITSQGVVSTDNITKVVISTGAASSCTVNSITVNVGTTKGGSDISTIAKTSGLTDATLEFERPANADWTGRYFTIVINVTVSGSSNKFLEFNSATFYAMK